MTDTYTFKKGSWNSADFRYVYSPICSEYKKFVQEDDCIANRQNDLNGKFDYVSMITQKEYGTGAVLTTHCLFEKYGAPLIVITDDVVPMQNGDWRFGHHIEVVAYEGGVNVWHIEPAGETTVHPVNLVRQKFSVPPAKKVCLQVKTEPGKLLISLDGTSFTLDVDCLPPRFFAGITACEGINRFYDFAVEE